MDDITRHEIPIQFFDEMVNEEDEEDEGMDNHHRHHHSSSSSHPHMHPDSQFAKEYDFSLRSVYPFTLINSEEGGDGQVGIFDENGKPFLGRLFPWGAAQTENLAHCDFLRIKELLFATHLEDFKTSTKEVLYENWRTEKLLKVRESMQADHQGPPRGREEKIQRQDFRS